MIKLSVIIPSKNRPQKLENCLESLKKHRKYIYEIIVGDDSSPSYFCAYQKIKLKYNIKLVRSKKKGLYSNHNFLFNLASGTHIRVVDDDHIIPNNHFYVVQKYVNSDRDAIWSIGEKYPFKSKIHDNILYPGELNNRGFSSKAKSFKNTTALSCGSSIFPKKIFKKNIFYLEKYPFGMTWLEFGVRLKMKGYRINIIPNCYVVHYYKENKRSFNSENLNLETKFFVIFFYNLIYKRNIINLSCGLYEILKHYVKYDIKKITQILFSAYKNFLYYKKKNIW